MGRGGLDFLIYCRYISVDFEKVSFQEVMYVCMYACMYTCMHTLFPPRTRLSDRWIETKNISVGNKIMAGLLAVAVEMNELSKSRNSLDKTFISMSTQVLVCNRK